MNNEKRRIVSYILAIALLLTTIFSDGMLVTAAELKNDETTVLATTQQIEVTQDAEGNTVYRLLGNVENGLSLTLENGESVVLDGNGYSIKGKTGTPGVQVSGSGTLQMKNVVVAGGDGVYDVNGDVAVQVDGDVDVVLSGMVNMTGGKAGSHMTKRMGEDKFEAYSGLSGMNFDGNRLIVSEGSNVSVSGSDAYEGEDVYPGNWGGDGLKFYGNRFLVEAGAALTLTGGNGESTYGGNALYMNNGLLYTGNGAMLNLVRGSGVTADTAGREITFLNGYVSDQQLLTENGYDNLHKTTIKCLAGASSTETDYYHLSAWVANSLLDDEPWRIENYVFDGWYLDEACTAQAVVQQTAYEEDMVLYAKYHVVPCRITFDAQGGSAVPAQNVIPGEMVEIPQQTSREGYTFDGWYEDAETTKAYDFKSPVTKAMTLFAKWVKSTYTVTFDAQGGSAVAAQTVAYKAMVTVPQAPTRAGYTFDGWYEDAGTTKAYDFKTPVTEAKTLYAKWNKNTYTVTFDAQGGSTVAAQKAAYGETVKTPAKPTRKGCVFGGWYTDKKCKTAYRFTDKVTKDITLYAKWYNVTLNTSSIKLQKGQKTTAVKAAVVSGDSVKSWSTSNKKVVKVSKKGVIRAVGNGKAVITVKTKKGASVKLKVTVQKKAVETTGLKVTNVKKNKLSLKKGKTFTLRTTLTPITSSQKVSYDSSKEKIAAVDKNGKIKALKKGKTQITVTSGSKKVKITVTVK